MARYCSNCGTVLAEEARFCAGCGRSAESGAGSPADPPATPASGLRAMAIGAGIVFAAAGLGAAAYYGLPWGRDGAGDEADGAAGNGSAPAAERQRLFAVGEANLRDRPTASGSRILGKLQRGATVEGMVETGADGRSRWLRVDGSGHYVSVANLSPDQPVALASTDGSDRVIRTACALHGRPSADGAATIRLSAGAPVKRVGTTGNGFVEYGLPQGGVGYAPSTGGCETDPSPAKGAVSNSLVQFDPRTCEFGPELAPYFDKAIEKRKASDPLAQESQTVTYPVDKVFHGLRVTHVLIGYEWHGLFFDAPVEKARTVFRQLGYRVGPDGDMTVTGEDVMVGAILFESPAEERKLGQSQLTCGV